MGTLTQLKAVVNDVIYDISDNVSYIHIRNDGFGMPPIQRFSERGPLQDGSTDLGFRLEPRVIRLVLNTLASGMLEYWERREELLYIFAPREEPIKLQFTYQKTTGTVTRELYCHTTGGLNFASEEKQAWNGQRVAIELTANDPILYDPVPLTGTLSPNGTTTGTYLGTYPAFPVFEITGPVSNLIITNDITGDVLSFDGSTIIDGETVTVDLRYGYKTVRNQDNENRISYLLSTSDFATFAFSPVPIAPLGVNSFTCSSTSTGGGTAINFTVSPAYIGF